jgi:ribosomal-protein-alanine N-acetyltransferase
MMPDVAEITRLERDCATAAHWSNQQYHELFADVPASPQRLILVAIKDGSTVVIGFLVARHVALEWELENIVVATEARGKGIGTHLLAQLLSRAQMSQSDAVFLEVRDSNTAARRLYEKMGFTETGRRNRYYSSPVEDAVLYRKTLRKGDVSG